MAGELDLSIGAYSNIERGVTDITLTRLNQIAEILEVSILEIIMPGTPPVEDSLTSAFYHMQGKLETLEKPCSKCRLRIKIYRLSCRSSAFCQKHPAGSTLPGIFLLKVFL